MEQWSIYFLLLSVFNLWGGVVFLKYGSGEIEPWAVSTSHETNCEQQKEKDITSHSQS